MTSYVSWNGATEVKSWKFYTSNFRQGPWLWTGTVPKDGFETAVDMSHDIRDALMPFTRYVSVEALDDDGSVLGSAIVETFVPSVRNAPHCSEDGCEPAGFSYTRANSCAVRCGRNFIPAIFSAVLLFLSLEFLISISQHLLILAVDKRVYRAYFAV